MDPRRLAFRRRLTVLLGGVASLSAALLDAPVLGQATDMFASAFGL